MYLIRCNVLCTLCLPLSLCTFCAYVIQHHFCHVFLCVPSQIVARIPFMFPVDIHKLAICRFSIPRCLRHFSARNSGVFYASLISFSSILFATCCRSFPCDRCLSFPRRQSALVPTISALPS